MPGIPLINLRLTLFVIIILFGLKTLAQAPGSLGDPVLNETFGIGSTYTPIGPPLANGITNLPYMADKCPADGKYTIASSTAACFGNTWHSVYQDHTGTSVSGYMMIINASASPDVFYVQKVNGSRLCPGAKYQFGVWILNVLVESAVTQGYDQPDISFIVESGSGQALQAPINTGIIPATPYLNWKQYTIEFSAPVDGSDVVVKLKNNTTGTRGNDLVLDDITVKPIGPLVDAGFGSATANAAKNLCTGNNAVYELRSFAHTYTDPQYQWQLNTNDQGWANIAGATSPNYTTPVNSAKGKYQYRVGVLSAAGVSLNCQTFSQPLTVNVYPIPVYDLPPVTPVCAGKDLTLYGNMGDEYEWVYPDGTISHEQSPTVSSAATTADAGIYKLTLTANGCSYTTSTMVKVYPPLQAMVNNTDQVVCEGGSVNLLASGGTTYKWTPAAGLDRDDIPNPVASPSVTTNYNVAISNGGCEDIRTVTVKVLKKPVVGAGADRTMQEGEPIQLQGTVTGDNSNHYWTPTEYLDDPSSLTPTVNPPDDMVYTLHAISPGNCGIVTDEVFIKVYKKISIPNTFSPNNDGVNDLWNIGQLTTYPGCQLNVYTRSGTEVFKSAGYSKPWNGNYQGRPLPAGIYYYVLDLKSNTSKRTGWVMLVR